MFNLRQRLVNLSLLELLLSAMGEVEVDLMVVYEFYFVVIYCS